MYFIYEKTGFFIEKETNFLLYPKFLSQFEKNQLI